MPEQRARLRVGSQGERRAAEVQQFLQAVEDAHDGMLAFLNLLDREARQAASRRPDPREVVQYLGGARTIEHGLGMANLPRDEMSSERIRRSLVSTDEQIVVTRVSLASPGLWEFLGALNPLTAINTYLEGRHERRKDREYRESADRTRLNLENERRDLENQLLETQVVQERLQLAQALGIYPQEQQLLLQRLAIDPMLGLARVADSGMAFAASALPEIRTAGNGADATSRNFGLINPDETPPAAAVEFDDS